MENSLAPVFLIERQEKCLCRSDFGKDPWNNSGIRGRFQGKDEEKHLFLGWRADRFFPFATGRPEEGPPEADMRNVGLRLYPGPDRRGARHPK